jgi:hypothetical protein
MRQMSRGEMIRRLDDVSTLVRDGLASGPLSRRERDALASSLETLLPIVAESLQDQEDRQAAQALRPVSDARHEKHNMRGPALEWAAVQVQLAQAEVSREPPVRQQRAASAVRSMGKLPGR